MFENYRRVLRTAKRPSKEEFWRSSWLVGLGILAVGAIGLIISLIFQVIGL